MKRLCAVAVVRGMKKRRVWWIVGSVVLLLLAFGTVALMVESQGERLHREVRAVVSDYGFIEVDSGVTRDGATLEFYAVEKVDEGAFDKISDRLESACKGCRSSAGGFRRSWSSPDSDRLELSVTVYSEPGVGAIFIQISTHQNSTRDRLWSWWPW